MEAKELAARVLAVLAAQKRYFADRTQANLEASKKLERDLHRDCRAILAGPGQSQGDLSPPRPAPRRGRMA